MPSSSSDPHAGPGRHTAWWPWLRRGLTALFFAGLALLLYDRARALDWDQVSQSLGQYQAVTLISAAILALISYAIYSSYDLIGRHYTGHGLRAHSVLATSFISYAFNLNLGALVGGVGFRYRLYSRFGLTPGTVTRVLGLSMLTNWVGYLPLAGAVFVSGVITLPEQARVGEPALRALGMLLLLAAPAYLALCAFSRRRQWEVRGLKVALPQWRMAVLQLTISMANWLVIAGIVYVLLDDRVDYPLVLGALLLGAIAGVLTHVPAGLGVLEAVFMAVLDDRVAEAPLLAALLAYRALYYLIPWIVACLLYVGIEARMRPQRRAVSSTG